MPRQSFAVITLTATAILLCGTAANAKLDFNKEILPIVKDRCLKCHSAEHEENGKKIKPKGDIRLDGAWAMLKGNKDTIPVVPKDFNKSAMVNVVTLPKDDDKFMPPEGKGDPLTPEEILKLKTWIVEGADFFGWEGNLAGKPVEKPSGPKVVEKPREHDLFYKSLAEGAKPVPPDVLKKVQAAGAQIAPLMADSPLLRVDFLTGVSRCDDKSIAALAPIKDNIAHLDLARTVITDATLKALAQFPRLARLDLRMTKVTDQGIAALTPLKHLTYLDLFGTEVTDKGLASLASLKSLGNVYLYETKVTDAGVSKLKAALPKAEIVFNVDLTAAANRPQSTGKGKKKK